MNQKEVQMMAAEFVLGTLKRSMLLQFKEELTQNPALRAAVKDWERRLGMESAGLSVRAYGAASRVSSGSETKSPDEIDGTAPDLDGQARTAGTPAANAEPETAKARSSGILRAEEGEWDALAPRVYKKLLNHDGEAGRQSYLLRMIPGGRIQPQRRGGIEEVFVLEGRVTIGDASLGPGDFQAFPATSFAPEITAPADSLILVRGGIAERIPDPEGTA